MMPVMVQHKNSSDFGESISCNSRACVFDISPKYLKMVVSFASKSTAIWADLAVTGHHWLLLGTSGAFLTNIVCYLYWAQR